MIRTRAAGPGQLILSLALMLSLSASIARAQAPAGGGVTLPSVPNDVKSAPDASASKAQIEAFIKQATATLGSAAPEDQGKARDALHNGALLNGTPKASPGYVILYAQLLSPQLVTLAANPDMRVRLNAAIVAASVAELAQDPSLAPAVTVLVTDKSDAVALWGVKAARFIVPAQVSQVGGQNNLALANALIKAVEGHATGVLAGPIAYDAYLALTLESLQRPTPQVQAIMVPLVQKLMELRTKLYLKGVPPWPWAEPFGSGFLSRPTLWPSIPAAQQVQIMQDFCDLIDLMAQQAAATPSAADRGELAKAISRIASAIAVIAAPNSAGPVWDQLKNAIGLSQRSTPAEITAAVKPLLATIQTIPAYKTLKAPPQAGGHEAPPPPASAPTTGPAVIPGAIAVPPPTTPAPAAPAPGTATTPKPGAATPPGAAGSGSRPTAPPPKPPAAGAGK